MKLNENSCTIRHEKFIKAFYLLLPKILAQGTQTRDQKITTKLAHQLGQYR